MEAVILVIHLILALSIIGLVLLQRSEGGGLGIGGGGGGLGGFASAKSTANVLSKTTWVLAICFFATSLGLGILAGTHNQDRQGILEGLDQAAAPIEGALDALQKEETVPAAPIAE